MAWKIFLTREAEEMLLAIRDRRVRKVLRSRAMKLQNSPDQQGKPLVRELAGFRSVRAVGQRYRIIYEIDGGPAGGLGGDTWNPQGRRPG